MFTDVLSRIGITPTLSQRHRIALDLFRKGYDTVDIAWLTAMTEPAAAKLVAEAREIVRARR